MRELNVGDLVRINNEMIVDHGKEGCVVAIEDDAGVYGGYNYRVALCPPSSVFNISSASLTRIEPAVPQPLFRVGQRVKFRQHGRSTYKVTAVKAITCAYALDGADIFWEASELEAVPEVCPTCGGKVGDAD